MQHQKQRKLENNIYYMTDLKNAFNNLHSRYFNELYKNHLLQSYKIVSFFKNIYIHDIFD